jgi:hypothetical protein
MSKIFAPTDNDSVGIIEIKYLKNSCRQIKSILLLYKQKQQNKQEIEKLLISFMQVVEIKILNNSQL